MLSFFFCAIVKVDIPKYYKIIILRILIISERGLKFMKCLSNREIMNLLKDDTSFLKFSSVYDLSFDLIEEKFNNHPMREYFQILKFDI